MEKELIVYDVVEVLSYAKDHGPLSHSDVASLGFPREVCQDILSDLSFRLKYVERCRFEETEFGKAATAYSLTARGEDRLSGPSEMRTLVYQPIGGGSAVTVPLRDFEKMGEDLFDSTLEKTRKMAREAARKMRESPG